MEQQERRREDHVEDTAIAKVHIPPSLPSSMVEATFCRMSSTVGSIRTLELERCGRNMTVTALRALGMAEARKSLERVTLAYSDCVARSFVSVLVTRFYALSLIDFTGCSNLCDVSIATVAVNCCENLIGLTVRCCPRLTSSSVRALAGEITIAANQTGTRCAALRSLDLSSCLRITAVHGVGRLRRLRFLSLSNLPDLASSKRLWEEVATLTGLQVLDISGLAIVNDAAVRALASGLSNLQSLLARGCRKISDPALEGLSRGCPRLQVLDISGCVRITETGMLKLLQCCTVLTMVKMAGLEGSVRAAALAQFCSFLPAYVRVSASFFGLEPIDGVLRKKLERQRDFLEVCAAEKIQKRIRGAVGRAKSRARINKYAIKLQRVTRHHSFTMRVKGLAQRQRERNAAATVLQGFFRRIIASGAMRLLRLQRIALEKRRASATRIAAAYRGHYARHAAAGGARSTFYFLLARKAELRESQGRGHCKGTANVSLQACASKAAGPRRGA